MMIKQLKCLRLFAYHNKFPLAWSVTSHGDNTEYIKAAASALQSYHEDFVLSDVLTICLFIYYNH